MLFRNEIEQYLKEIRELEKFFREAQSKEILPLSFFSSSIDILNRLRTGIYEIEATQLQVMHEHLSRRERIEPVEIKKPEGPQESNAPKEKAVPVTNVSADIVGQKVNAVFVEEKTVSSATDVSADTIGQKVNADFVEEKTASSATGILADTIGRKTFSDFGKSVSLNDRFMIQRDLFQGDSNKMNQAFAELNAFQSTEEAIAFLNEKYAISWNSEAGSAFKELLDKRFV